MPATLKLRTYPASPAVVGAPEIQLKELLQVLLAAAAQVNAADVAEILTVAVVESTFPSLTLKVKLSVPTQVPVGV